MLCLPSPKHLLKSSTSKPAIEDKKVSESALGAPLPHANDVSTSNFGFRPAPQAAAADPETLGKRSACSFLMGSSRAREDKQALLSGVQ
jgi:hypothetical protein